MGIQEPDPNLPDVAVGLGGAGKNVVRTLLKQEWIVESIVAAAADGGQPECYFVDAETERSQDDTKIATELNNRIKEAIQLENRGDQGEIGDVVSALNLAKHIENEPDHPSTLLTGQVAKQVVQETDIETWWLKDDPAYLCDGFRHGTMRRRALAKALPPATKMLTPHGPLDQLVPEAPGADAVLVAGLGGGLGSGIALDLARRMDDAGTEVTLFGILPGDGFDDRERERANSHAVLSELEYLALTDDNPFENVVLVPTPGDLSDIQTFDEAIAYAVLAHSNLSPDDRMALDETQTAGPARYAPFTVTLPQVLRFEVETVDKALAETVDWLYDRQYRLEVELDLYYELADLIVESFPEASDPVVADMGVDPAPPEEAPAEPMQDPFDLPVKKAKSLLWRVDTLLETLDGDLFEILDDGVAMYWLQAIEQVRENAQNNAGDDPREILANLVHALPSVLNDPVQGEPNDSQVGQILHDTVRMELKAVIFRSRILRAAHRVDSTPYRKGVLNAAGGRRFQPNFQRLRPRIDELTQRLRDQRERMEAVEAIHHEVEKRCDDRIAKFQEEAHDAIETLVLIARHHCRIEELLDRIEELIRAFVTEVECADNQYELLDDPLDSDLFDELNELLGELELNPIDHGRLLESARAVVEAKAALLDWQDQGLLRLFTSNWPERYNRALDRIDIELFDIPTSDEAEQEFYCEFVDDHIFDRPRETIEGRQDEAIDYVTRATERAVDTSDLNVNDFRVSMEDNPGIEWTNIDDSWRMELQDFLSSIPDSCDPPSAGQALGELCDPGGIVREAVEDALLTPVDRVHNTLQHDFEATESDLDRTERLQGLIGEQGVEFATRTEYSQFPAPGTDLGLSHRADRYVRKTSLAAEHLVDEPDHLAETDHPKVQAAIEEFLSTTVYPFKTLDDRAGLAAGDVVGESNRGQIPYDDHRVVRSHFGTVFGDDGGDLPTDDALAEVANAVGGNGNAASRHFGFGDPWEVAVVTFVGGVFLDNLSHISGEGYRSAYARIRNDLGERTRVHHAHGLDGRDPSLVESGDNAGLVYRDQVLNVHDHTEMGPVIAAAEDKAAEWILKECVATQSFVGHLDSNPADDAEGPADSDQL